MKNNLIICDVETGGMDEKLHPITQITMEVVDPHAFQTLHYFETFVKPYNNLAVEPEALQASRVTMQQVNDGCETNALMKGMLAVFKVANKSGKDTTNPYFVGHNFGFDMRFLNAFFVYKNQNLFDYVQRVPFDTLAMMKLYEGNSLKSSENQKYNLTACCERMDITIRNQHGSGADVQATKNLFIKLVQIQRNNANPTNGKSNGNSAKQSGTSARAGYFFEF